MGAAEAAAQQQVEAAEQRCAELEAQVAALRQQLAASMMEGEDTKQQLLMRVQTATVERDNLHAAMMQAQAHAPPTPVIIHPYAMPPAGPPPPPPQQQQQGPGGPAPPGGPGQFMPQVSCSLKGWWGGGEQQGWWPAPGSPYACLQECVTLLAGEQRCRAHMLCPYTAASARRAAGSEPSRHPWQAR